MSKGTEAVAPVSICMKAIMIPKLGGLRPSQIQMPAIRLQDPDFEKSIRHQYLYLTNHNCTLVDTIHGTGDNITAALRLGLPWFLLWVLAPAGYGSEGRSGGAEHGEVASLLVQRSGGV